MEQNSPQHDEGFRFDDPRQERTYRRLRLLGPGPAAFFRDACRLMAEPPRLETQTHLVAHCLREIESAVRHVLRAVVPTPKTKTDKDNHRAEIIAVLDSLEIQESDAIAKVWLALTDKGHEYALHRLAHRDSLRSPRRVDSEFRRFWEGMLNVLDSITAKIEERFVSWFPALDALASKEKPSREDAAFLRQHVPNNSVTLSHFFDQLSNPDWLDVLRDEEFFSHAPEPVRDAEKGTIGFPSWAEARYLARTAAVSRDASEKVVEIVLEVSETENERGQYELIDALLAAPADLAARAADTVASWLDRPWLFLLPDRAGELLKHLAAGGEAKGAERIARALLRVQPRQGGSTDLGDRAEARFELWEYERIIEEDLPTLVEQDPRTALSVCEDTLAATLQLERRDEAQHWDGSYVWYRSLEQDIDRPPYEVKQLLVLATRRAAEKVVQEEPGVLAELVERFEGRGWAIFKRLALHLARLYGDSHPELVRRLVLDKQLLDDVSTWHEFSLLLRERFRTLGEPDRNQLLEWIEEGPHLDEEVRARLVSRELANTEDDFRLRADHWRLRRLSIIASDLPEGRWRDLYQRLRTELIEPDDPTHHVGEVESWWGPRSPKDPHELRDLSVPEIVEFMRSWEPPDDWKAPSPEGLGRALSDVVAEHPERFASEADRFRDLDPTYVRAVISGLRQALQNDGVFPWPQVLKLCSWVLEQPRDLPQPARDEDEDPGWGWTWKAIADLLGASLEDRKGEIPIQFREAVWRILQPLTEDPEPTPEYEAKYGGDNMDPPTLAINTVRGEAMHAVVQYALWVRRSDKKREDAEAISQGFDRMPEVRRVLEEHLDAERDPSLAARSVYGQRLPWIALLDERWTNDHLGRIFPLGDDEHQLRQAAWDAYLRFCAPYDGMYRLLKAEYGRAIAGLEPTREESVGPTDTEARLAQHLMAFYLRGVVTLDSVQAFFEHASDAVRGEALEFLGRAAREATNLREEHQARLRDLWEWRVEATSPDPSNSRLELAAFGWWFSSEGLDEEWLLDQLLVVLDRVGEVDPDHLVVKKLAETVPHRAGDVARALRLLIEGDREGWRVLGHRSEIRDILRAILAGADADAARAAQEIVNVLVARGYPQFRDLIDTDK